jgi:hypothetical protein
VTNAAEATKTYTRSHMSLEYLLPSGGRVVRGTNREIAAEQVAHARRYAHATEFRVHETTTVETVTTADITAEVIS